MKRAIRAIAIFAVAVAIIAGGALYWANETFKNSGPLKADSIVIIKKGSGLRRIAEVLHDAGVIRHTLLFVAKAKWTGAHRDLKAGEYEFVAGIAPAEVLTTIRDGRVVVHSITVPEGLTSHQVAALVNAASNLEGELGSVPAEGTILPETYDYSHGDTRSGLLRRMIAARNAKLAILWQARAEGLPFTNPEAAVTLASIVEKETGTTAERPRVAAVFINRLRRGMRLQSDPTVVYAHTGGKRALGRRLLRADLSVDHPYNTYLNKGLPPGPIANPGAAALKAVLQPAITGDLYFVADGTGGHAFAKTLQAHNRNVARWRRLQRKLRNSSKLPVVPLPRANHDNTRDVIVR